MSYAKDNITDRQIPNRINMYKVYLSIMVVFIHSYGEVNFTTGSIVSEENVLLDEFKYLVSQEISRCAVPAFFLISSVLLYSKDFEWKKNIKKKIRTLVVPYLILNTFWVAFYYCAQQLSWTKDFFSNPDKIVANWTFGNWLNAYLGITDYPMLYPLWFVRDLFVLNLLAGIIKHLIDKFPKIIMVVLIVLAIFEVKSPIFCLSTSALCYWSFGYYLAKYNISLDCVDKIKGWHVTMAYVSLLLFELWLKMGIGLTNSIFTFVHNIGIIVGIIFWFRCTAFIKNEKYNRFIQFVSRYSFGIYIFHEMNLTILKKICAKILPTTAISQLIQYVGIPFVIIGCCIVLCVLMERCMPRVYAIVVGGRKR